MLDFGHLPLPILDGWRLLGRRGDAVTITNQLYMEVDVPGGLLSPSGSMLKVEFIYTIAVPTVTIVYLDVAANIIRGRNNVGSGFVMDTVFIMTRGPGDPVRPMWSLRASVNNTPSVEFQSIGGAPLWNPGETHRLCIGSVDANPLDLQFAMVSALTSVKLPPTQLGPAIAN